MSNFIYDEDALDELANAIILQACNDYFISSRAIKKGSQHWGHLRNVKNVREECLDFFHSSWYADLSRAEEALAPTNLLAKLDRMVDDFDTYPTMAEPFKVHSESGSATYTDVM